MQRQVTCPKASWRKSIFYFSSKALELPAHQHAPKYMFIHKFKFDQSVERRIGSQMRFQVSFAFEIIRAHSPVFIQDEMIYRIKPGNIGGQLQKARACCRVYHSSCQGNFRSFQTVMRHSLSIQGRDIIAKVGGMGATQPAWRAGVFGRALPPQKQTESWKDAHVNKAGRQLQLCTEAHPFPDQSLRQRDSPRNIVSFLEHPTPEET